MPAAQRKPREVEDTTASVLDRHLQECASKNEEFGFRLGKVEDSMAALASNVADLTGQLKIVVGLFVKEKPQDDGSTSFVWHIPKPSLKTLLGIAGSFGGLVLLLQFVFAVTAPAIHAGARWILAYGH